MKKYIISIRILTNINIIKLFPDLFNKLTNYLRVKNLIKYIYYNMCSLNK